MSNLYRSAAASVRSFLRRSPVARTLRIAGSAAMLATMLNAMPSTATARPIHIDVELNSARRDCKSGLGFCVVISWRAGSGLAPMPVSAEIVGEKIVGEKGEADRTLRVQFLRDPEDKGTEFVIGEDIELEPEHARALGYQRVMLRKGVYTITRDANDPNGSVDIAARTIGVTITADIGRKAHGCERAGICKLTVSFDLRMNHPATGSATLEGTTLAIDFAKTIAPDDTALVIDEDIELDEATALALGAKRVIVRAGTYLIDRSENPNGHVELAVARIGITITVDVGRKSKDCTRAGVCAVSVGFDLRQANSTPTVGSLDGSTLVLDFMNPMPTKEKEFVVEEEMELDPAVARSLGVRSLTLKSGTYAIDYSSNPNGTVRLATMALGITIKIRIGVPSLNCRGFGFCGIEIGPDSENGWLRGIASLDGNTLSVDFAEPAGSDEKVIVIEEDIALSPELARSLGARSLSIKAGHYAVSNRTNANGTVELPVERTGITVTINVGRASRNCSSFGICSIVIGFDLRMKSPTVGAAVLGRNGLAIDFATRPEGADDTLYIDEAIELELPFRAAGVETVRILPGAYVVDYSRNENGSVVLSTAGAGTASVESPSSTSTIAMTSYPNPATTRATIDFTLATSRTVELAILDAHGQTVATIIDGERLEAGIHTRTIDIASLPVGAYFIAGPGMPLLPIAVAR